MCCCCSSFFAVHFKFCLSIFLFSHFLLSVKSIKCGLCAGRRFKGCSCVVHRRPKASFVETEIKDHVFWKSASVDDKFKFTDERCGHRLRAGSTENVLAIDASWWRHAGLSAALDSFLFDLAKFLLISLIKHVLQ